MVLGTMVLGLMGDKFGRRPAIIGSVALFGLASLATAFAQTTEHILVLRFIAGLGMGGATPVLFLFQPAEEGAPDVDEFQSDSLIGAQAMIRDGALETPKVEAVFGVHVMAGYPTGHLYYNSGTVLNSSDSFRITVTGHQTHGSAPWSGVDPIIASQGIIGGLQTLVSRRIDLTKGMGVISIGTLKAGTAANIIPETVEMTRTIRTNNAEIRESILQKMPPLVSGIASGYDTQAKLLLVNKAPVTRNDPALTEAMVPALELAAPGKVERLEASLSPSEDFSYYGVKAHVQFVLNYPGRAKG